MIPRFYPARGAWAVALAAGLLAPAWQAAGAPDFQREIRPILSNICYKCHGPDGAERKGGKDGSGGLRLDTEEGSRAALDDGVAIMPGQPEKSALVARIKTGDPDDLMPPPKSGRKLSPQQIELLEQWVKSGGKYVKHWSYEKPRRPSLPEVKDKAWVRNGLDAFILARLEKEGLAPQPEADRLALARRVALDLTGLPPTPEEADAFAQDKAPDAYERYVDRLLASPAYGEHWARQWLDLARYADSAGYADDPGRTIWAYRDWVIRAFNANRPFDQFTIEQIAGDLLPSPTDEQLIATAFHRNTMTNNEGGTNDEEFRNAAVVDRTNTTMSVWMGTSFACAQCHTHKYDPITNAEYFQVFAFLNNTQDADRKDEAPLHSFLGETQKAQRAQWETELAGLEAERKTPPPAVLARMEKWVREFPVKLDWQSPRPSALKAESGAEMQAQADGTVLVAKNEAKTDTYTLEIAVTAAWKLTALLLESLPAETLPGKGAGHGAGNFVVTRLRASIVPPVGAAREIVFASVEPDFVQTGFDPRLVLSATAPNAGQKGAPQKGWAVGGALDKPHQLTLLTAQPTELPAGAKVVVTIEQQSATERQTLGRFRVSATSDARVAEHVRTPADVRAALASPVAQRPRLVDFFTREIDAGTKADAQKIAALRKQIDGLAKITVPIQRDLEAGKRRKTRVQLRGNYLSLAEEVTEGVPAAFPPLHADAPKNRLTLARWLVDDANPLTPRVTANRFWESIFGTGIVRTSEEFGAQGELPSHPELLDWLATELVREKWDVKKFLRLLVTSAAYRQSSKVTPELTERDPGNRLLARGPRFRLSAEMVRDQALAASGLLSRKMFGPPVRPPRPNLNLSAAFGGGLDWQNSTGEDAHRRALYTEWRRTAPYPSMATFDAPNREVCTLRRNQSNTPLQALVTLNDPVFLEAAQGLARRMTAGTGTDADKAARGFRFCVTRPPTAREMARLLALHDETHAYFKQAPEKALALATNPIGAAPAGADLPDLAAWTTVANVLLNMDETLMKR